MKFFKFIANIFNVSDKAKKIRENKDTRGKSVRFALLSIAYSVLAFAAAFAGAILIGSEKNLLTILIIIIGVALLLGALTTFIAALVRVIAQFTINRNAMSWIALIIFIVAAASSVFVVLHYVG